MRAFDLVWRALGEDAIHSRSRQIALAGVVLAAFLDEALGLGVEIGGVVALVGNAATAIELEDQPVTLSRK